MGLLASDSWNLYNSTAEVTTIGGWSLGAGWSWSSSAGRNSDGAMVFSGAAASMVMPLREMFAVTQLNTMGWAGWVKISTPPAVALNIFTWATSAFVQIAAVRLNTNGTLQAMTANNTASLGGSANICDNVWHWIEIYTSINSTGGREALWVDGATQWDATLGFGTLTTANIYYFTGPGTGTMTLGWQFAFNDVAGGPRTSGLPFGPQQISLQRPVGDSATIDFTPDTGSTLWTQVDEQPQDGDASYIQDNVSGHTALLDYQNLGFTPGSVKAVNLKSVVRNPGFGSINFKNTCKSVATSLDGASTPVPSLYAMRNTIYDNNPSGSVAWTGSAVDSAQFGLKVA